VADGAVPDLRRLLTSALGHAPDRAPTQALEVARAHRLPLAATAAAVGLAGSRAWADALAAEQQVASVRRTTLLGVRQALGAMTADVAVDGPPWRPVLGSDVDLLVPAALRGELVHRLVDAGLFAVGWHAAPDRAVLARTTGGSVMDVVDVQSIEMQARVRSGAPATVADVRPEVGAARVARSVAARAVVRLRDLADVEALGTDPGVAPPDPRRRPGGLLSGRLTRGWTGRRCPGRCRSTSSGSDGPCGDVRGGRPGRPHRTGGDGRCGSRSANRSRPTAPPR
jgi:hypothetical protein